MGPQHGWGPPRPEQEKRSDNGVDGYINFFEASSTKTSRTIVVQVKSGKVNVSQIRDLRASLNGRKPT